MTLLASLNPAIFAVQCLAVVGAAVLGGLACGSITRFLVKRLFSQKLTERARWLMRGVGGVLFGWLAALALFSGGGYSIGGAGGFSLFGGGSGSGASTTDAPPARKDKAAEKQTAASSLVVEVLGPPAVLRLYSDRHEPERCYRIEDDGKPKLLELAALKKHVGERLAASPPLGRVEIVLYKDSPERRTPRVAELQRWLKELTPADKGTLKIDLREPDEPAPAR